MSIPDMGPLDKYAAYIHINMFLLAMSSQLCVSKSYINMSFTCQDQESQYLNLKQLRCFYLANKMYATH